jgi:hypothetical protein
MELGRERERMVVMVLMSCLEVVFARSAREGWMGREVAVHLMVLARLGRWGWNSGGGGSNVVVGEPNLEGV